MPVASPPSLTAFICIFLMKKYSTINFFVCACVCVCESSDCNFLIFFLIFPPGLRIQHATCAHCFFFGLFWILFIFLPAVNYQHIISADWEGQPAKKKIPKSKKNPKSLVHLLQKAPTCITYVLLCYIHAENIYIYIYI